MKNTVAYYNTHAQDFYNRTIDADVSDSYAAFLKHLPQNAHILDAGCGVGRDSKYFLGHGYVVTAFDASDEMVAMAAQETALDVQKLLFQDMHFSEMFDGVWAQASLLHVPYDETRLVYEKIHASLKPGGVFYASYKYGAGHVNTPERDFWNMTETTILPHLEGLFTIQELWVQEDKRNRGPQGLDQKWLNFVVQK